MIHPHTELRFVSDEIGYGVFATQPIPRGTIIWVQDPLDREIAPDEVARLDPALLERASRYCYRNRFGHYVLCWDHTRYMNHSFNTNCVATPYRLELAVRDIAAGEELTSDYGTLNIVEPFEPLDEGHFRKVVHPDDLANHHAHWDALLAAAFPCIGTVQQPLRSLVSAATWETCLGIAAGREPMRSIRECYHVPSACL